MSTMKDIAKILSERNDMARNDAEQFVAAFFDQLKIGLANDEQVKVKGLGTFKIQTIRQRASVNVNTGERVLIDSHERISFTPDKAMADAVNRPFAHFETVIINDGVVFDDIDSIDSEVNNNNSTAEAPSSEPKPAPPPLVLQPAPEAVAAISEPETVASQLDEGINESENNAEPSQKTETNACQQEACKEPIVIQESVVVNGSIVLNGPVVLNEKIKEPATEDAVIDNTPQTEPVIQAEKLVEDNTTSDAVDSNNDIPQQNTSDMIFGKKNNDVDGDEYNVTPDYNPGVTDLERKDRWFFRIVLGIALLVLGFIVGRFTADFAFSDILVAVGLQQKKAQIVEDETTIVYTGEEQHELQAAQDSVIADSLEKEAEKRIVTKARKDVEERIEQKKQALAAGKQAAEHDAELKVQAEKKLAEEKAKAEAAKKSAAEKAAAEKAAAAKKQAAATAAAEKADAGKTTSSDAYSKDPRIRYGAYKIVGIAKTVTVQQGQTLQSISKTHLGPGMECYLEALNGVKEVKAGQKIKIPELKLKKAAK